MDSRTGFVSAWTGGARPRHSRDSHVCLSAPGKQSVARNFGTVRMAVTVDSEQLPESQVRLKISVGAEECTAAWDSVLKEVSKRATIDGFRKGKAPMPLVIRQFGKDRIKASACEELIEKNVQVAIDQVGVNAIGQAVLDDDCKVEDVIANYEPKEGLTFTVKVDVWPDAKLTDTYEGLQVTAEKAPFDESLVENALQELRRKEAFSILSPEGTKAELGKIVVGSMNGFYRNEDGSKGDALPDIASGDKLEINMKEGQYMPGFVEGIVGMDCGETRSVNVEFPVQSGRPELAGQKAIFDITVHAVKDEVLPELDDEFAKKATESPTLESLKEAIRARLNMESESITNENVNKAIEESLCAITEVTLPETMVEERVKSKFAKMLSDFKEKGMSDSQVKALITKENYELYKKRARINVERSLTANFAIAAIAKEQGLAASDEEIEDQMTLIRSELRGEEMEDEQKIRDQVQGQLERGLVLEHIKKSATITMQPASDEAVAAAEMGAAAAAKK